MRATDELGEPRLASLRNQNAALKAKLESVEQYTARALMRATRLSQVVAVLGDQADLETTVDRASVELAELFAADLAVLIVDFGDGLSIEGHWGINESDLPRGTAALDELRWLAHAEPVGIATAQDVQLPEWLLDYKPRHLAWAQLAVGDRSVGLMLLFRREDDPFATEEGNELRAIAYRIALAIENGLLHRRMTSQLAQLHRLQELTSELAGTVEADAIGRRVAQTLVDEAGAQACVVFADHDGAPRALAHAGEEAAGGPAEIELTGLGPEWRRFPLRAANRTVGFVAVSVAPAPGSERYELFLHLVGLGALALDKALIYDRSVEQARRDSLTGLLGHRVFHEVLDCALAAAEPFSVVLFDIDDFKEINDLHGHQRGDEVLRAVAAALRGNLRGDDAIFRVGGEEFCAVLPAVNSLEAQSITERLRMAAADAAAQFDHPVTLSAGVATFPDHAAMRDELLAAADAALYRSKRAGKDRSTIAGDGGADGAEPVNRVTRLQMLFEKDSDTVNHSIHTAILAVRIARHLGLDDGRLADLRIAAKLHDVGKIGVPDAILMKPGPLDDEEFRIIKTHPVVGAQLLSAWGLPRPAQIVLQHHERIDGGGYPSGLAGDEITLESRIIHVADAYVAMTLDRPYRQALTEETALTELRHHRGTQFDARVVDALLAVERARSTTERLAA